MSKNDCMNANWNLIGQQDGFRGSGSLMQSRSQACLKHQITLDRSLYTVGYKKGLRNYCNPQTVFDYALQGKGSYQSCPMELQNNLRPYYNVANNFYVADKNLRSLEDKIATSKAKAYDYDLEEKVRKMYRDSLSEANNKLGQAQRDYSIAERDLMDFKRKASFAD